ncbi:hypothetical protein BBK82_03445 [Lentzea guizhouensis]|uniref:Uncharacterized protein n=1 Tax=Lentzea guizhouensis TaxID=1586287 RepID=A0A1B2HC18_9PSEU|nr:hypothetical protein [Lentzea guizhouensis]ANZ35270.1 hypothetical protein BBK82_03445 [Lentzea guizhouensis]
MADVSWAPVETLPKTLDVRQATVYRQAAEPEPGKVVLGGQWLVWPDQVWWQMPVNAEEGGEAAAPAPRWKRSHLTPEEFDGPMWTRVEQA